DFPGRADFVLVVDNLHQYVLRLHVIAVLGALNRDMANFLGTVDVDDLRAPLVGCAYSDLGWERLGCGHDFRNAQATQSAGARVAEGSQVARVRIQIIRPMASKPLCLLLYAGREDVEPYRGPGGEWECRAVTPAVGFRALRIPRDLGFEPAD